MRMVKCKKCGTPVLLDTTAVENMYAAIEECNRKSRSAKNGIQRNSYIQEASQIKKMITQIQHRTTQIEERKTTLLCEYSELRHYIRENKLVSDDKLDELRDIARQKAKIKNAEDEKVIQAIYGEFESMMTNRTKRDPTAKQAIKRT